MFPVHTILNVTLIIVQKTYCAFLLWNYKATISSIQYEFLRGYLLSYSEKFYSVELSLSLADKDTSRGSFQHYHLFE